MYKLAITSYEEINIKKNQANIYSHCKTTCEHPCKTFEHNQICGIKKPTRYFDRHEFQIVSGSTTSINIHFHSY